MSLLTKSSTVRGWTNGPLERFDRSGRTGRLCCMRRLRFQLKAYVFAFDDVRYENRGDLQQVSICFPG